MAIETYADGAGSNFILSNAENSVVIVSVSLTISV